MASYTSVPAHGTTFNVHRDHVGFVIGRKYITLNQIARDTNTRIKINDNHNDNQSTFVQFVIAGRSHNDIFNAYQRINEVAARAEQATPRVAAFPIINQFHPLHMNAIERRIYIHPQDVGMVLGAKARTLKKIQFDTWTWAKLIHSNNNDPLVSVRGFLQNDVDEAIKRIASIAQESLSRRTNIPHTQAMTMNRTANSTEVDSMTITELKSRLTKFGWTDIDQAIKRPDRRKESLSRPTMQLIRLTCLIRLHMHLIRLMRLIRYICASFACICASFA